MSVEKRPEPPPFAVTAQFGNDGPLTGQLDALCKKLLLALCHNVPPRTRERHVAAISLIAEFFKQVGFPLPIYVELKEFAAALQELDRGAVRDFLRPASAWNHPVDSSDVWQARAHFAIAVEQLRLGGLSKRAAIGRVARCFPETELLMRKEAKNPASAIADWHRRLANGSVKEPIAQSVWRHREDLIHDWQSELRDHNSGAEPNRFQIAFEVARSAVVLTSMATGKVLTRDDPKSRGLNKEFFVPPNEQR